MKLKIKTNFDFSKLSRQLDKITGQYLAGFAVEAVKGSKDNIDRGLKPPLEDSTKDIRKWRTQPPSPPLKASGQLYNSIKPVNNTLEMDYYGWDHHTGFKTHPKSLFPNWTIPARPFIATTAKNRDKIDKEFMININKALKK